MCHRFCESGSPTRMLARFAEGRATHRSQWRNFYMFPKMPSGHLSASDIDCASCKHCRTDCPPIVLDESLPLQIHREQLRLCHAALSFVLQDYALHTIETRALETG